MQMFHIHLLSGLFSNNKNLLTIHNQMPFVLSSFYMYEQFNTATSGFSLKKESLSAKYPN